MSATKHPKSLLRRTPRLGLIVNPIAGMGGALGLHGTDGELAAVAAERGAKPRSHKRAGRAIRRLFDGIGDLDVCTVGGQMGEDVLVEAGVSYHVLFTPDGETSRSDTESAARRMAAKGVDLILFAGGDGTAVDVCNAAGHSTPTLGIPTGVKMHSGVFGTTPENAGDLAASYLRAPNVTKLATVDVQDIPSSGEALMRTLGFALVPHSNAYLQPGKSRTAPTGRVELEALCRRIADEMEPARDYWLGPGSTTSLIARALGVKSTLRGVDMVRDGRVVTAGASETDLLEALSGPKAPRLILGVIGGQGFVLGRGNLELTPAVLDRLDPAHFTLVASRDKLLALDPMGLHVDVGDEAPQPFFGGYVRVHTGPGQSMMLPVLG